MVARLANALLLALTAGCGAFGDNQGGVAQAFSTPCMYPRDPLTFDRTGPPCLLPAGEGAELPCEMQVFTTGSDEPRLWNAFEYDDQGRVIAEELRPLGRAAQSFKYAYENAPGVVTVKRTPWVCDRNPIAAETKTSTAAFDDEGALATVDSEERTVRLRYESTNLGLRTNVTISDGATMYSFKLNRRGEIVSRNQAGSKDFPSVLDYDHSDGRVSQISERSRRGSLLRKVSFSWEEERLTQVDVTKTGYSAPFVESTRFVYECKHGPSCSSGNGFIAAASSAAPAGSAHKPSETMPAAVAVDPSTIDGMQRARAVQKQVDAQRRIAGKQLLRWDDTLFSVAQREADDRSRGVTAFDPLSLHMLGYRVAVRVERLSASAGASPENDTQSFAGADVWDALGSRSVGLGVARVGNGLPDTGKLALVVVSAKKER